MSKLFPIIGFIVVVLLGVALYKINRMAPQSTLTVSQDAQPTVKPTISFATPKKSAHYESNTPAHGAILPAPPVNIVIDFNFDLAPPSAISIVRKQTDSEIGVGETTIDKNKLSMRRSIDSAAADGMYVVVYKACWPDGSCHDGSFEFAIDRAKSADYQDERGKKAVTVRLADLAFGPKNIRVSEGTTVTWVNDDTVEHYVNTDGHPAHTYEPKMNSKALGKGESYSYTFSQTGSFPYHCSAHAGTMTGIVVVE